MPYINLLGIKLSTFRLSLAAGIAVVSMVLAYWLTLLTDGSIVNPLLAVSLFCIPLGIAWAIEIPES